MHGLKLDSDGLLFWFPLSPPHYFVVSLVLPKSLRAPSAVPRTDLESHDRQPHAETWPCPCCHRCCPAATELSPPPANSSFLLLLLLFSSPGSVCLFLRGKKNTEKTWNSSRSARRWTPGGPGAEAPQRGFVAFHEVWISSSKEMPRPIPEFSVSPALSLPRSTFPKVLTQGHTGHLFAMS